MTDAPRIFRGPHAFEGKTATRLAYALRSLFLEAIESDREASEMVLGTLYRDVYKANLECFPINMADRWDRIESRAREMWREANPDKRWIDREWYNEWDALAGAEDCYPELVPLREAIRAWSIKSHLDADWIRDEAFNSVRGYSLFWIDPYKWENHYSTGGPYFADRLREEALLEGHPDLLPYKPGYEDRPGYLAARRQELHRYIRIHPVLLFVLGSDAGFGDQLDAFVNSAILRLDEHYCKRLSRLYSTSGYKRVRSRPDAERHVKWAVESLVLGYSYSRIRDSEEGRSGLTVTDDAVKKAVKRVLRYLHLQRQPGRKTLRLATA